MLQRGHGGERLVIDISPTQQIGKPGFRLQREQLVLPRVSEVRVDQQRAFAELRQNDREVRSDGAATVAAATTSNRECRATVLEPPEDELAAQFAQRLGVSALGFVQPHEQLARV